MAIVQMQRINICALKKNRKAILERLQELGAMEIDIQLEDDSLCEKQDVASSRALFERRAQTADQALAILNIYVPEKKGMLDSLAGKPLVEKELFEKAAENQDQYMATASRIVTLDKQIAESKAAVCSLSPFCYKIKTDGIVFHDFMAQQDDNNQCCQCAASPCDYPEVNFDHPHTGCSPGGRNMIL